MAQRDLGPPAIVIASQHVEGRSVHLTDRPDAVYFLMFDGWKDELRSNRWHFAKRWARYAPVILLQPSQATPSKSLRTEQEPRIPNTRILYLQSSEHRSPSYPDDTMVQIAQVTEDMKQHGVKHPLLWCYNPNLVGLYAALPAMGRVLHATENYFHFDGVSDTFLDFYRTAIRVSDLIFAVSDGVAASILSNVPGAPVAVITNGCDYEAYSRSAPDRTFAFARESWDRAAIYAGNINNRLDFELLVSCARKYPQTLFAFFGPVHGLSFDDLTEWRLLLKESNVRYFGPVAADLLPGLYGAADIGMIPYKRTQLLVENGFPLKALEMCATGLPVVSTFMKPIQSLCDALVVATDHDGFVAALGGLSRQFLTEGQRQEMRRVCRNHDYDQNFATMIETIEKHLSQRQRLLSRANGGVVEHVQEVHTELGRRAWRARARMWHWCSTPVARLSRGRIAKAIAAITVIVQDPGARRMLAASICMGRAVWKAGSFRVMKDLLRLGMLGYEAKYGAGISGSLQVVSEYDAARRRLIFRTAHLSSSSSPAAPENGCVGVPENADRIREVIWDHSQIGHNVSLIAGTKRWSIYLGRDGVYQFAGVEMLLRQHPEAVAGALRRISASVARPARRSWISASVDIERGIDHRTREFIEGMADLALAARADIDGMSRRMLTRLDQAYRRRYPDLLRYVPTTGLQGRRVLQLGLGAGAVGRALLTAGCRYVGIDRLEGLVALMQVRLRHHGFPSATVMHGSPLEIPFESGSFDYVVFLDILRGRVDPDADVARAINEIRRVLVDDGHATLVVPAHRSMSALGSRRHLARMLRDFTRVKVARHGPDFYITARR